MRPLAATPRLLAQAVAVAIALTSLPAEVQVLPVLPWWPERALLLIGGVWFVNLVNFMDGIDWITVAEVIPITAALVLLAALGGVPAAVLIVALALGGAVLGFAPFNRPVARLFLGDVGSLPIGLLLGWMLLVLASHGHLVAAIVMPLYCVADTTITLVRRMLAGQKFWTAHRSHFYQRALDNGLTVAGVIARVAALNGALAALAAVSVARPGMLSASLTIAIGGLLTALVLFDFSRKRR
jgi:UDP-N-acetylmuramyl pentapeptide phosphotransferase/UDP-N-acetylglucosamine-1-phosphate transferase